MLPSTAPSALRTCSCCAHTHKRCCNLAPVQHTFALNRVCSGPKYAHMYIIRVGAQGGAVDGTFACFYSLCMWPVTDTASCAVTSAAACSAFSAMFFLVDAAMQYTLDTGVPQLWRWWGSSLGDKVLEYKSSGKRGCGRRRPTSHCACPLNVCLASGNYRGCRSLGSPLAFCFLDAEGPAPQKQLLWIRCFLHVQLYNQQRMIVGQISLACMSSLACVRSLYCVHAGQGCLCMLFLLECYKVFTS
jgi:hypothetical protein